MADRDLSLHRKAPHFALTLRVVDEEAFKDVGGDITIRSGPIPADTNCISSTCLTPRSSKPGDPASVSMISAEK